MLSHQEPDEQNTSLSFNTSWVMRARGPREGGEVTENNPDQNILRRADKAAHIL